MDQQSKQQDGDGFTLLETVIAIGLILFGLVSVIALSTSSLIAGEVTSDEFLAANFAAEAIEAVRTVRDSNWLAYDTDSTTVWNEGLSGTGSDYSAVVTLRTQPLTGRYLEFTPNAFGDTCTGRGGQIYDCTALWYDQSQELYFQIVNSTFNPSSATISATRFSRMVFLYPLCRSTTDETDEVVVTSGSCSTGYEQVGVDVIATVQWTGARGTTGSYTLEEYLYDWKY